MNIYMDGIMPPLEIYTSNCLIEASFIFVSYVAPYVFSWVIGRAVLMDGLVPVIRLKGLVFWNDEPPTNVTTCRYTISRPWRLCEDST